MCSSPALHPTEPMMIPPRSTIPAPACPSGPTGYGGAGNGADSASGVAIDGSNNVIVTGYSFNGTNDDYLTIKYSSAGAPLWTNRYNGPGNDIDVASAVAIDGSNNVIVTGYSFNG